MFRKDLFNLCITYKIESMKKFALLFVAMLISTTFFAQEHLDFRGVPLDGHIDGFISKMEELGYTLEKKVDNAAIMSGKFTGKDVELYILSSPKTKTVWKVAALFEKATSWSSLKSSYLEYKELYTQKYGKPESSFEFFKDPYYEGDGYELQALRNEKCHYFTMYELEGGVVAVQLMSSGCLQLGYEDNINGVLRNAEKTSSALDEI